MCQEMLGSNNNNNDVDKNNHTHIHNPFNHHNHKHHNYLILKIITSITIEMLLTRGKFTTSPFLHFYATPTPPSKYDKHLREWSTQLIQPPHRGTIQITTQKYTQKTT